MASASSPNTLERREFSCSYCHREFGRLEHLQRHVRRHTHEKPYDCSCGALFSRRDLLRRHERIVHGLSNTSVHRRSSRRLGRINSPERLTQDDETVSEEIGGDHPTGNTAFQDPNLNNSSTCQPLPPDMQASVRTPSIFPAPHMSLKTQIVPYFAHPIVTDSQRNRLLDSLRKSVLSEHSLPSTDSLTRYLAGYFTGFYPQAPFTHAPTFRFETCSPELCLAMLTVGAVYRHESHSALKLFSFSKALMLERQREEDRNAILKLMDSTDRDVALRRNPIDDIQCLLCLSWFVTWQKDPNLRNEIKPLRSALGDSLRSSGLDDISSSSAVEWEVWAQQESAKRSKLLAFCFLNVQSMAYDLTPVVWSHEINLRLPCACPEWTSPDATTWAFIHNTVSAQGDRYHDALKSLIFEPQHNIHHTNLTPVANYTLLHGMIQKIMWNHKVTEGLGVVLSQEFLQNALSRWTSLWQQTPESNLEPMDPNGPLPFVSTALLSFAYIRNCTSVAQEPPRRLVSWDPATIATILRAPLSIQRDGNELIAAHHATHVLETLVRLGVQYVQNHQASVWNIEVALCGLECFYFLAKWLRGLASDTDAESRTESENCLLSRVQDIVREGLESIQGSYAGVDLTRLDELADQILQIGSHAMQGNSPWPFIRMVGDVLGELSPRSEG